MTFPMFERLARLYHERMAHLFQGSLDLAGHPELIDTPEFRAAAWRIARGMAKEVAHANATSWRAAAIKSTRAREIYLALEREIQRTGLQSELDRIAARNANLIMSLPTDVANHITAFAARQQRAGARPETIEREIRRRAPEMARSRMRLIARTETSRAETDLTRVRSERIGIDWAQWATSGDQRVRPSHRNLDKVLMSWNDPPQPEALIGEKSSLGHGFAGQFPNCRCVMLPVADLDEVRWPAKVYTAGAVRRMTRVEFTRLIGVKIAA